MPNKRLLLYIGGGCLLVGMLLAFMLYLNRGSYIRLEGSIQKVRTLAADEKSCIAVIDFRLVNPADFPFVVRRVDVTLEDSSGKTVEGTLVADVDAKKLFEYYPLLGPKYNDSLVMKARINPRQSLDRMVAVRFEVPEKEVQNRKRLKIRIEDLDGAVSEIVEERK